MNERNRPTRMDRIAVNAMDAAWSAFHVVVARMPRVVRWKIAAGVRRLCGLSDDVLNCETFGIGDRFGDMMMRQSFVYPGGEENDYPDFSHPLHAERINAEAFYVDLDRSRAKVAAWFKDHPCA